MDILMGLVIAMFIITAAYVGFHAADQPVEEAKGHDITIEPKVLGNEVEMIQVLEKSPFSKLTS